MIHDFPPCSIKRSVAECTFNTNWELDNGLAWYMSYNYLYPLDHTLEEHKYRALHCITIQSKHTRERKKIMKRINDIILRKCKSLKQLGRSSSYRRLRSMSTKSEFEQEDHEHEQTVYVGSAKRRYVINSKYTRHPVVSALIESSKPHPGNGIWIRCEVVMFEHLLWMLDSADDYLISPGASYEDLADLYKF